MGGSRLRLVEWSKKPWVAPAGRALVVVLVVGLVAYLLVSRDDDVPADRLSFDSREVPGEFAYLDPGRVQAYLSQIQGGLAESEEVQDTRRVEDAASIGLGGGLAAEASVNAQRQRFTTRVVTPTDTSNYLRLLDKLDDPALQQPPRLRTIDAAVDAQTFADRLMTLREGDFVVMQNVRMLMPVFARPYDAVKRLRSLSVLDPATGELVPVTQSEGFAERMAEYADRIGPNPRIVINVGARAAMDSPPFSRVAGTGDVVEGCPADRDNWKLLGQTWPDEQPPNARVLIPFQFVFFADEPSLFSGGNSTIVGKVVRVLRPPTDPARRPRRTDVCYEDQTTLNTFGLGLPLLPQRVFVDSDVGVIDRERVTRSLLSDLKAIAPGAVVVPVAAGR
jgi:hypothetical protein